VAVISSVEEKKPAPARAETTPPEAAPPSAVQAPKVSEPQPSAQPQPPPLPVPAPRIEPAGGVKPVISPAVRSLAEEKGVDLGEISPSGPGGRITQGDVLLAAEQGGGSVEAAPALIAHPAAPSGAVEQVVRKPMTPIRQRIAARLLEARRNTAMLTSFNEIDMSRVLALRARFGEEFKRKHGVKLGIMSFFIKASVAALKEVPEANAFIEGNDILYHNYYHIGIAVGAPRGLVVPVIRNADRLSFAGMERAILGFVEKISQNRLDLSDLEGGTFTITNGGVYGSLLSTPILNPPQSAILGMHKTEERPIAVAGKVEIRPMMYVALSYDHRILDGREAVGFLKRIKDFIENPERMLMEI